MDQAQKTTDQQLQEMEKKIEAIYKESYKGISDKWIKFMDSIQGKADQLLDALNDAKKSGDKKAIKAAKEEYQKFMQGATLFNEKYKAMVAVTSEELKHVSETALSYVNGELPKIYANNYNQMANETKDLSGYSFAITDPNTIKNLATKDKTLLPYKEVNGQVMERWNTKIINSQVMQGILQGEDIPTIAKRLEHVTAMTKSASIRNARTMTTSAQNKGRLDSYKQAQSDGVILQKQWLAALDDRTRLEHQILNGQTAPIDQPFVTDLGGIMYPGDIAADDRNVYNCRCTLKTVILGFMPKTEEEKQQEEAEKYKEKYLSDLLQEEEKRDIIKAPIAPQRPKKSDFDNEDDYRNAREIYKSEREKYYEGVDSYAKKYYDDVIPMSKSEMEEWAKRYDVHLGSNYEEVDERIMTILIKREEELFEKFPQITEMYRHFGNDSSGRAIRYEVGGYDAGKSYIAEATRGIHFGEGFKKSPNVRDEFIMSLPDGISHVYGNGAGFTTVIDHEFGHNVFDVLKWQSNNRAELEKEFRNSVFGKNGMSEYASTNVDELFAEAFSSWLNGDKNEFTEEFDKFMKRHPLTNDFSRLDKALEEYV